MRSTITILNPGFMTTIQDRGRIGYGSLGVSSSGAFDHESAAAANRMVVNSPGAAVLECMIGGLEFRVEHSAVLAFAGAHGTVSIEQDGQRIVTAMNSRIVLGAGATVRLETFDAGLRGYVAIRGGIDVQPVLGSRSTDTLGRLGPAMVAAGDVLPVGEPAEAMNSTFAMYPAPRWSSDKVRLDVVLGPRTDWFTADSVREFFRQTWTVTQEANRVGLRMDGIPLRRAITDELASEGMVPGAIQVPASGQPIVFGPDHPATGGYPVIGVLTAKSRATAGQLVPGTKVGFHRA